MQDLKNYVETEIKKSQLELTRKVSNSDLQMNFKAFNSILLTKFIQIEDVRQSLKDVVVYQKYMQPLQLQTSLTKNLDMLQSAQEDVKF